jgi:hypothetical protein
MAKAPKQPTPDCPPIQRGSIRYRALVVAWKRAGLTEQQIAWALKETNEQVEAYNEERRRKGPRHG